MKKAVVVGGSNGIGLTLAMKLIEAKYYVVILDRVAPDSGLLSDCDKFSYEYCDLLDYDEMLIDRLSQDMEIEALFITAGFGRVADFEYLHTAEIQNMMQVNTVSAIKIIRSFYDRIKSENDFYCGVMGSIAGLISSPMFSVYAASKAAICRFVESVNVELEVSGTSNRILNVSPGSIKGTKFNGGSNDVESTSTLATEILKQLFSKKELFIPQYDEIYKGVIDRYNADPHEYGVHSYNYKIQSGRAVNERRVKIGYLSGTFDLFHIGHLNLLRRAKKQCDYLIVGVHPDASHKGKQTFIPFEERKAIVSACRYVDRVVDSCPEDSDAWDKYHYDKLFVGSDYKGTERFIRYEKYFADKNVEIVYFDYTKGTSSTQIRNSISEK
ncbi:MAG: SDR family NAD(P)-dependent oxidoreductase [Oscillospiraceae bacterium]|nr:SDR family NAD(P)-dependent oxidoreductase [Oscillospiraceae bacterium]